MSNKGILYLIPTTIGDTPVAQVLPEYTLAVSKSLDTFIVEQLRTARRFLSKIKTPIPIDDMTFFPLNKHTELKEVYSYLAPALEGKNIGLLSEAGTPCIADPGSIIVEQAHLKGIQVIPLVGPNSIILALMASGFNGQNFCFHGYIPIDQNQRSKKLKEMEANVIKNDQTQIFIEAPYRNKQILDSICKTCSNKTKVCVAVDISLKTEYIRTKTVTEWKKSFPDFHKKPSIFLIYK
ncbi:MAG: SAM-dependent methyltransferase [Bacteroidales bacterium]